MIDLSQLDGKNIRLADVQHDVTHADLITMTNAMVNIMRELVQDARDEYVTFLPEDPLAQDNEAATPEEVNMPWTLGHVIVHATASAEEYAANASSLARGVPVSWRNRYETPWQEVVIVPQMLHRLEESRRIRLAYLNTWPDQPHLEVLWTKSQKDGDLNAIGYMLRGLRHDHNHLGQLAEIMRQAREALG